MLMIMRLGMTFSALVALLAALPAGADEDFLPPEQAFAYLVQIEGDCLKVQWNVAPGYYLYKSRMSIDSATSGVKVGTAHFPKGESHHDEYFGDQEIFRDDFIVDAPLERTDRSAPEMTVKLKWQGCADAGLCYPVTTWVARVKFATAP
jgi:thiol:disulfide interchange protein DsbD